MQNFFSDLNHISFIDLRLFKYVVDEGSLTKAAPRVFLSLSAASLRLKNLEETIGCRLLTRSKYGVVLTEAGTIFLRNTQTILEEIGRLQGDMIPHSKLGGGRITVLANTTAISEFLPSQLAEYLSQNPSIVIDLKEGLSHEVVKAVHENMADIGFIAGDTTAEGLESIPYREDRLVIACPVNHELAEKRAVNFIDTVHYDYVGLDAESAIHRFTQKIAMQQGISIRLRIQVRSFDTMCRIISNGVGIGILPESAGKRLQKSSHIRLIKILDDWSRRELRVCAKNFNALPLHARQLVSFVTGRSQYD
jgi:DNA-binding transcriptional LysR family regulator